MLRALQDETGGFLTYIPLAYHTEHNELGEELGLIRSEELLAARALDGARQYFTRAFDFGFSKTVEEAFRLWPRDSVLKDVVRVVRRFRPQLIISVFSGTDRDGHGQHQEAGWAAREVFADAPQAAPAAGSPTQAASSTSSCSGRRSCLSPTGRSTPGS